MTTISAREVVTPTGILRPGAVTVADGRITEIGEAPGSVVEGHLLPAFVDLQVNGYDDVAVAMADDEGWERLESTLLRHGVTAWCPTLVSMAADRYAAAFDRVTEAGSAPGHGPTPVGLHLEGPFLNPDRAGAHPTEHLRPIDLGWLASLPPIVRVVTLAPELERAIDAVGMLADRGVLVSLGHSEATFETARAAADAGARLVTHVFNTMPSLHHRVPGLVGAALVDGRLTAGVIADLVHVHPAVVQLVFRAKGVGGVVLTSDAVAWRDGPDGPSAVEVRGGAPRFADGTLAGSCLTAADALRHAVQSCGVALGDAVAAASTTPADLLGLADRGRIALGARADLLVLDDDLRVRQVWLAGELVVERDPE